MADEATLPGNDDSDRRTVTDGFFEREVYLAREETAEFLRDLADQVESDSQITVSSDDWEIPFAFDGPIEVEVEFSDKQYQELEIELEFTEPSDTGKIDVS
jgi:amphi-Trp domain-containing protein